MSDKVKKKHKIIGVLICSLHSLQPLRLFATQKSTSPANMGGSGSANLQPLLRVDKFKVYRQSQMFPFRGTFQSVEKACFRLLLSRKLYLTMGQG